MGFSTCDQIIELLFKFEMVRTSFHIFVFLLNFHELWPSDLLHQKKTCYSPEGFSLYPSSPPHFPNYFCFLFCIHERTNERTNERFVGRKGSQKMRKEPPMYTLFRLLQSVCLFLSDFSTNYLCSMCLLLCSVRLFFFHVFKPTTYAPCLFFLSVFKPPTSYLCFFFTQSEIEMRARHFEKILKKDFRVIGSSQKPS